MPLSLFKTDYIEIKYYASKKLVETTWVGMPPSHEYRNAMKGAIAVLKAHDIKRWIGDYRQAIETELPDQDWVAEEWAPVFIRDSSKLDKMAKVSSLHAGNKERTAVIGEKLKLQKSPFLYQEFDDYEAAMKWINS